MTSTSLPTPALAGNAAEQAPAASPAAVATSHSHAATCLNCEAALTDKLCGRCGQPAATHRLTMRHLLHNIPHFIWRVDKGLFYTLRELLQRPGPMLPGYLRGQRARHFQPLSLLLVTGIYGFPALKLNLGAAVTSS